MDIDKERKSDDSSFFSASSIVMAAGIDAYSMIEAESYSSMSGVKSETCSEGGQDVGYMENGDYIVFNSVDFGSGEQALM